MVLPLKISGSDEAITKLGSLTDLIQMIPGGKNPSGCRRRDTGRQPEAGGGHY